MFDPSIDRKESTIYSYFTNDAKEYLYSLNKTDLIGSNDDKIHTTTHVLLVAWFSGSERHAT